MATVTVQKAEAAACEAVVALLNRVLDPSLGLAAWSRLFEYRWQRDETHYGYMLTHGSETVGFVGLIFSERQVNGRNERFCNITSLVVTEEYRDYTPFLLRPLMQLKHHTLTDLTPNSAVCRLLKPLGFQELDRNMVLLLPGFVSRREGGLNVTSEVKEMENVLHEPQLKILRDHLPYPHCGFLLVQDGSKSCLVVFTMVTSLRYPYCHIQYVSDPSLFVERCSIIRREIARRCNVMYVLVDGRFARSLPSAKGIALPFMWRKMFRSASLQPEHIDNLYSENILLNLRNVPTLAEWRYDLLRKRER